ncbi:complement C1r subcomponent [Sorex fumeus]|uniref:complement C1r subcomponent n=1 Tax=Sorex fumeus TaxID=62283 RepID=UPI0024ADA4EB|nr:complement C1r subcomponent [Sorex fumeus]
MWFLYLLVPVLLGRVGGSSTLPPKLFGELTSPLYPKPYPNNLDNTTVITVPEGYRVKLVFWFFDLEPSEGCFYDYVKLSADKKTLGRFCGQQGSPRGHPPGQAEFMSQGNKMLLTFHTDFSNEENGTTIFYKGFLAYYQAVDLDECAAQSNSLEEGAQPRCQQLCHNYVGGYFCSCRAGYALQSDGHSCQVDCGSQLYTEASGYISSVEYPQPYGPDLRCNYSIRVERGLTLRLKFLEPFEIDDHQQVHCPYDQLQIYANGRNIGEFCGTQRPPDLDTSSNAVDLLFFTDESGDSRGWKVHYTTEIIKCPQPKTRDEFSIIQNPQSVYQFRDYIIVTCKEGYQLVEGHQVLKSFTTVCEDDGTWHRAMPKCQIRDCGPPRALLNGAFSYTTTNGVNTYQAGIQYRCNEPYYKMQVKEGISEPERGTFTCTAQGRWKNKLAGEKIPRCLPVCGKPVNPVEQRQRIIGGARAKLGNFPWQAYTNIHGRGGGALLGDRWILTAAHTLYPKNHDNIGRSISDQDQDPNSPDKTVTVFLGHVTIEEIEKLSHHPVRRVIIHPDYVQQDAFSFEGDIALLELENSVTLGPNLLPICLPNNETLYDVGLMGYVSGFGVMRNRISPDLKFVHLPVAKRESCEKWLRANRRQDVFSENMFCAGDPTLKQDACQGDSGGVFAVKDEDSDHWTATGIVSWGIGCGKGYGFYTKLLNYVDWIKKEMGEEED